MITHIKGLLIEKSPTEVVVETNGVGYSINISLNTFSKLGDDDNIKLFTHQIIKEDSHLLYGFYDKSERFLFVKLISVSGVGASTARTMLSSLSPSEIISAISKGTESSTKASNIKHKLETTVQSISNLDNDIGR